MSSLLGACEDAVRRAKRQGLDAVEVFGLRDFGTGVEIEKGALTTANTESSSGFGVRVHEGQRVGFAYASDLQRIPDAFQDARKSARLSVAVEGFSFPGRTPAPRVAGLWDARVAHLSTTDLLDMAQELLRAVLEVRSDLLVAGGAVDHGWSEMAIANSEGLGRQHRSTGLAAHAYVINRRDGVSTGSEGRQSTRRDLRPEAIGREAARLAIESARPRPLPKARKLTCLVRPESAGDLLSTITLPSLYGKPAHRGESFYSGKQGRRVLHPKLSIFEDPTRPAGLGSGPFDDEGVPARRRPVVRNGVLKTFLYDRHDAAHYGAASTGNAFRYGGFDGRSYKSPPSTSALETDIVAPKTATAKLVSSLDDGLLIHDMMGVHTANIASGDFSVTSSVVFRIRKGAIEGPVSPLSVAGNLHRALQQGIRFGDDVKPMGGAPALRLPTVAFTGFSVTP